MAVLGAKSTKIAIGVGAGIIVIGLAVGLPLGLTQSSSSSHPIPHDGVKGAVYGVTGPTGGSGTSNCRDATGTVITCESPQFGANTNIPLTDIDRQPRPFKNVDTGQIWYPIVPTGCNQNIAADAGADERYEFGCEPQSATWYLSTDPSKQLNINGTIVVVNTSLAAQQLLQWHTDMEAASLWTHCKLGNPKDTAAVEAWWTNPTLPLPQPKAACAKQFLDASRAYHYEIGDHP